MASLNGQPLQDHIRSMAFARRASVAGSIASRADAVGAGGKSAARPTRGVSPLSFRPILSPENSSQIFFNH